MKEEHYLFCQLSCACIPMAYNQAPRHQRPWFLSLLLFMLSALVITAAPTITIQSSTRNVLAPGQNLNLNVSATGSGTITYQWLRKGKPIAGATNTTLAITNASYTDSGWYLIDTTDSNGTTRSKPIFVIVAPAATRVRGWGDGNEGLTNIPTGVTDFIQVAASPWNAFGLRRDGTVLRWGKEPWGFVPVGMSDIVSVASAYYYSGVALKSDGTVAMWGGNYVPPAGLSDVVAISMGGQESELALKSDGTVVAWGGNIPEINSVPVGLTNVIAISSGGVHSLALKGDGTVVAWGLNNSGQCNVPAGLNNVIAIAAGGSTSFVLKADGTVVVWGDISYGQGSIPSGLLAQAIATGGTGMLALKTDGTLATWGVSLTYNSDLPLPTDLSNVFGIFAGAGTRFAVLDATADAAPSIVTPPASIAAIETQSSVLSVSSAGAPPLSYQWRKNGANISGATSGSLPLPSMVLTDAGAYDVVVSNYLGSTSSVAAQVSVSVMPPYTDTDPTYKILSPGQSAALTPTYNGPGAAAYQWYHNGLAIGGATATTLSLTSAQYSDSGYYFALINDPNGTQRSAPIFVTVAPTKTQVRSWGNAPIPDNLPDLNHVIAVAGGKIALKNNGAVVSFGHTGYSLPAGLTGVVAIAASDRHALALRKDGTVVAWGENGSGQVSVPADLTNVVAIQAGDYHSLALKSDGTVVAWGDNAWNQRNVPAGLTNVVAVSAGYQKSLAIKGDGTVVGWGSTLYSIAGDLAGLTGVSSLVTSSTASHLFAMKQDGAIVPFGSNYEGQTTIPTGLSQVSALATGAFHSMALLQDGTVACWGRGSEGQCTPPENLANVFAISAGYVSSCAVRDATNDLAPTITVQPAGQTRIETRNAVFSVTVTGPSPYSYQWRKGGVPIADATASTLKLIDLTPADAGNYDVVITNYVGSTNSAIAALTVNQIPVVTSLSQARQVVAYGQSVNLAVTATGTGTLTYQWSHNGLPLAGATGTTLALASFARQDAGYYLVNITDNFGTRVSKPVFLFFSPGSGPTPTTQLRPWGTPSLGLHNIPAGLTDVVDIAVSDYNPLALRANGTVVGWGDYGSYFPIPVGLTGVVGIAISGSNGAAVRSDGTVVVWGDNSYKQCDVPAGLGGVVSVACGYGYTLALKDDGTVVGWGGQYTSQSPYNPVYVQNVPGGLKNIVAIAALQNRAIALRSDGLTVTWPSFPEITGGTVLEDYTDIRTITGRTITGMLKRTGTVEVSANGYWNNESYVPPGLSDVVALYGSDALFAVKTDGSVVAWRGTTPVALPEGIPNIIRITDMFNGGLILRDSSADTPPGLSTLTGRTQTEGQSVSWTSTATGPGPFTYQWRKNGANIASATSSTLTLPSVLPADAGSYDLVVTNYKGVTTSNAVLLTVLPLPVFTAISPTRQVFDPGQTMTLNVTATGTGPLTYQWFHNGRVIPGANSTDFSTTNLSLQDGGWYLVDVTDNNGKRRSQSMFVVVAPSVTKVHVWGDYVDKLLALKPAYTDIISVSLSSDGRYAYGIRRNGTIVNWGEPNGSGLPPIPAGLTNVVAVQVDALIALKSDGTVVSIGTQPSANANVLAGLSNVVSIEGSNGVGFALKYDGTVVAWSPDLSQSDVTNVPAGLDHVVALAAGVGYALALKDNGTVMGWGVSYYPDLPTKAIPSDLTDVIALNAGAGGIALRTGGLVTQWGWNGRHDYPSYTHCPLDVDDFLKIVYNDGEISPQLGGVYSYTTPQPKTVKNLYKIVSRGSAVLALSGESAPLVTLDPVSVTQRETQKVMLAVAATGLEPLTIRWRKNGTAIPGATSATLIFDEVALTDAGNYDAVITNSLGSATSKVAQVTVIPVPVIASHTISRNVRQPGEDMSFSVVASGTGTLSYQWSHNGRPVAGATQMNLELSNLSLADQGWYLVNVTDSNGTRRSPAMFLAVAPANSKVTAWGSNYSGATDVPPQLNDAVAIATGGTRGLVLALRRDGTLFAWGGSGLAGVSPPTGLTDVVAMAVGNTASLALKSDGTVVSWNFSAPSYLTPPAGLRDVVAISATGEHAMALKSNGTVVGWGYSYGYDTAVPNGLANIVSVADGVTFSLALDDTGKLISWGSPVSLYSPLSVDAVHIGGAILVRLMDGTLSSIGVQYGGGMPIPAGIGQVIDFASGYNHALALKSDGTVIGWNGSPDPDVSGADLVPAGLDKVFAVSAGSGFSVAIAATMIAPSNATITIGVE